MLTTAPDADVWRISHWEREVTLLPDPVLRLSSIIMVRDAVRTGAGAALLPRSMIAGDLASGRLVTWGAPIGRPVGLWALHTSRRLVAAKVTAFVQLLGAGSLD